VFNADLSIRDLDGQAVVVLRGEPDLAGIPDVASCLIAAVAACGRSVIVDLTALNGISDGGVPVLLRVLKWTRQSGGDLPLAAPAAAGAPGTGGRRPARRLLGVSQCGTSSRSTGLPVIGWSVLLPGRGTGRLRHRSRDTWVSGACQEVQP
jgi:hypothetical protein